MDNIKLCRICNLRDAKYICRKCGGETCEYDFDPYNWICIKCIGETNKEYLQINNGNRAFNAVILMFLAFLLITFGFILIAAGNISQLNTVTIIFPFLITTDPTIGLIAFLIVIIIFILILYIFLYRIPKAMTL